MRVLAFSLLMLLLSFPGFAQTPAGPVGMPGDPQASPQEKAENLPPPAPAAIAVQPTTPNGAEIVVPRDTLIPVVLRTTINTKSGFVGEAIYCKSIYPITVENKIIIPEGSSIRGTVTEEVRPGRARGRAKLGLRFDESVLPNGTTRQLRASLAGFGSSGNERFNRTEGQIEGNRSKNNAGQKVEQTTNSGAEIGSIVGWGEDHPVEGVAIGAAAGAATGVIWMLATRANDIVLPPGTTLTLELSQPVTFSRADLAPPEEQDPPPRSPYDAGPAMTHRDYTPKH